MTGVAVVVPVELPPFPDAADLDRAAARVRELSRSDRPLTIAVPGRLWEHLSDVEISDTPIEWLRLGWNEPDLTVLPERARSLQLERETEALAAVGIEPSGLFTRTWDPTLVPTLLGHEIDLVVVPADGCRPGVVDRFDRVVTVLPATFGPVDPGTGPGLCTVVTDDPESTLAEVESRGHTPTTPRRHLADHPPRGRLRPAPTSPAFSSEPADAASEILYRRMLGVAARLGERPPPDAVTHLLEAQHHALYPGPLEPRLRLEAHRSLLRARRLLDRRRRGDAWTTIERTDWDADGAEEIEIESGTLSLVVDPRAGRILFLDDKASDWPVTAVPDDGDPGLVLARALSPEGVPRTVPLDTIEAVEQRRGGATLHLADAEGTLSVDLVAEGHHLTLTYRMRGLGEGRIGPELPLALDSTRMRVDGGEWRPVDTAVAASGHRFRFSDGTGEVLVVMPVPGDCFARPLEPFGIVVWPHWPTAGDGDYELWVDLAP